MKTALIGNTGFVGSNLNDGYSFDDKYNSKNIKDIKGKEYDLIVCCAIPASMWMANNFPKKDLENIQNIIEVLKTIKVKKFILISSICVFKQPVQNINEDSKNYEKEFAYGKNRRYVEKEISNIFTDNIIIRIPALFGSYLKKNFIYDILNQEPGFIADKKYQEIINLLDKEDQNILNSYYIFNQEKSIWAFDKEKCTQNKKRNEVLDILKKAKFTALNFTNSESYFQFYDLSDLWSDINIAIKHNIKILHLTSQKIQAKEIAKEFFNVDFKNDNGQAPFDYDLRTKHANYWNKESDYQYNKNEILTKLGKFIKENKQ